MKEIKPNIGEVPQCYRSDRREEVVLARARMGHTHFTHGFLLRGEPVPECIACQSPLTVKHILIDCVDFSLSRDRHFKVDSLDELFNQVNVKHLFDYLKEIGLFYKF